MATSVGDSETKSKMVAQVTAAWEKQSPPLKPKLDEPPPGGGFRLPIGRIIAAVAFVGAGAAAVVVGASSIAYQVTHLTVNGGIVNSRTIRLRAPISGSLNDFYVRPGIEVRPEQVLARIRRSPQEEQSLLLLEGQIAAKVSQLSAAIQSKAMLEQQLQGLEVRANQVETIGKSLLASNLDQQQAALRGAMAQSEVARLDYERYQQLQAEGAISQQKVDQVKASWDMAVADVDQVESALQSAQTELNALQIQAGASQDVGIGNDLIQEAVQLRQQIQAQAALVTTLTTEQDSLQKLLTQAKSAYSSKQDLTVIAPAAGVVYRTDRERNEQVNQSEPLLTLLDCKDMWIDVMVSTYDANQIDTSRVVKIDLEGEPTALTGEVDLIQPMSSMSGAAESSQQVQALQPSIPLQLAGLPVTRITVRIPPMSNINQSQQFCGVGRLARVTFSKQISHPMR